MEEVMAKLKALTKQEIIQLNGANNMYSLASNRTIKYIVLHYSTSLSSEKGSARNSATWFNNPIAECSADYICDEEEIIQYNCNPERKACWAVGGGPYIGTKGASFYEKCTNLNSVSIEMSSQNTHKSYMPPANDPSWSLNTKVINNAIRLTRYLMNLYGLDITRVIRHYDVNGKPCPGVIGWNTESGSDEKWNHFLWCVKNNCSWNTSETTLNTTMYRVQVGAFENKKYADALCNELKAKGYADAFVKED